MWSMSVELIITQNVSSAALINPFPPWIGLVSDAFPVCRCGIALALNKLAEFLDVSQVTPLFLFFVPDALNDRHTEVRRCMLDAALSALNTHGKVLHPAQTVKNIQIKLGYN